MNEKRLGIVLACVAACGTRTPSRSAQLNLEQQAAATLAEMEARSPGLSKLVDDSAGVAVFPNVGAGGAIVAGGAFGRGILFEHGVPAGYVELRQGSIGPQLGGQTYGELLVLRDRYDIDRVKSGELRLGADASAIVLTTGAAVSAEAATGMSVFVMPRGGLMAGVSITGQTIAYRPLA